MAHKAGENITREWRETGSPELWDALHLIKSNPGTSLDTLTDFAENGSALAMVYLGDIYSRGKYGTSEDKELAEYWLRRSAETSIEGSYQLALLLRFAGRNNESIMELIKLASLKYSPAFFELGSLYLRGNRVEKDLGKAIHYFSLGEKEGHLFAASFVGTTLMNMGSGFWLRGLIKKISAVIPLIKMIITYPSSDKIRIIT